MEDSVFHRSFSPDGGYPRFTSSELPCRSVSNHPVSFHIRFLRARFVSRSGLFPQGRFPSAPIGSLGFAVSQAGSPRHQAESSFSSYGPTGSPPVALHPTFGVFLLISPFGDAVTLGFRPVERLVERALTSFSVALSGAPAGAQPCAPTVPSLQCSRTPNPQAEHHRSIEPLQPPRHELRNTRARP